MVSDFTETPIYLVLITIFTRIDSKSKNEKRSTPKSMKAIYLAFANSQKDYLPSLSEEDSSISSILSEPAASGQLIIAREQHATTNKIIEDLFVYQNNLFAFHFSGHADRDRLFMEDQQSNAEGIVELLKKCPNLVFVMLNGCSTKGQVKGLLDAGIPVVIATSAPVEDRSATQFSIRFYQSLIEQKKTIQQSFEDGIAAAKVVSKSAITVFKGLGFRSEPAQETLWGIYSNPENTFYSDWRFESNEIQTEDFEPNVLLLETVWEAIRPFIHTDNTPITKSAKLDLIIERLPHPISDHLRKLIANPVPGEQNEFYNQLGFSRLCHLVYTYTTCIELLAFSLLAQLWDELTSGDLKNITDELKEELDKVLKISFKERKTYPLIPLIRLIRGTFEQYEIKYFIKEFDTLNETFRQKTDLYKACDILESLRLEIAQNEQLPEAHARSLCIEAEKQLAVMFSYLGFLAKYKMTSMKDIEFIKYKHQSLPSYRHNFVELRYRPSGMNLESLTMANSMDNSSVMFINQTDQGFDYLNLSPFIIDVNSFDDKAQLADLCFFLAPIYGLNSFIYRYSYRPTGPVLMINKQKAYYDIIFDQFNAFHQLIFQKPLF